MNTMFSRRHYEAIAEVLGRSSPTDYISLLADLFESDNPRFDRQRFLDAVARAS